jgi:HSP20 family protein
MKTTTIRNIDDFEVLFRDFFNSSDPFNTIINSRFNYPVDIYESPKGLQIEIAAVGLSKEDIEILIEDGDILRVSHKKSDEPTTETYLHRGITRKSFSFGWKISAKFTIENLEAKLSEGLLSITIPFSEKADPKKIKIQ